MLMLGNMKVFVVLAAVLLVAHQAYAAPPGFIAKCMSENGVTAADAINFAMSGEASDKMKCNFKCIMLANGGMTEDGKLVLAPMLEHAPEKMHAVFKECVEIEPSADLCDLAFRHNKCLRDKAVEWYTGMTKGMNS